MLKIETDMTRSSIKKASSIEDAPSGFDWSEERMLHSKCESDETTTSIHGLRVNAEGIFSTENEPLKGDRVGRGVKELIFIPSDELLNRKLAERDAKIYELTMKLREFERKSIFEFDGLDLPNDYYENDAYSDR